MTSLTTRVDHVLKRYVGVAINLRREEAIEAACDFIAGLTENGITALVNLPSATIVRAKVPHADILDLYGSDESLEQCEIAVVFGGDGTILRASSWALRREIPILGVNLGHVGFLAELESWQMSTLLGRVVNRDYEVEKRMTLDVVVRNEAGGQILWRASAINEVSLEKQSRERMIDVMVQIDGRPLSRWGTDGVLVSTPTGSTAYAFSANGPVMWPDLSAILLVPLCAHALFARPMVLSPKSYVTVQMLDTADNAGVVWCDGRDSTDIAPGMEIEVRTGTHTLQMVRLSKQPFVDRLVRKFALPVEGWRGAAEKDTSAQ